MKVHVMQIPVEGARYDGEIPGEILELDDEQARSAGPLRYSLDVGLSDGGLWARGRLAALVTCRCVRCLEPFQQDLVVADFACQVELQGREMVDLTDLLREDILLALPAHPHCDWDGEKSCKARFNTDQSSVEPLDEQTDAWKALDKLKL